jgi:hypothetical protein
VIACALTRHVNKFIESATILDEQKIDFFYLIAI